MAELDVSDVLKLKGRLFHLFDRDGSNDVGFSEVRFCLDSSPCYQKFSIALPIRLLRHFHISELFAGNQNAYEVRLCIEVFANALCFRHLGP
jgi:hypothetical protein